MMSEDMETLLCVYALEDRTQVMVLSLPSLAWKLAGTGRH